MSLAARCIANFDSTIRSRGAEYFQRGQVKLLSVEDKKWTFEVLSSSGSQYKIILAHNDAHTSLQAACECPYFESGLLCKHVWASILEADKQGLDQKVPRQHKLFVLHGLSLDDDDDDDEDDDGDSDSDENEDSDNGDSDADNDKDHPLALPVAESPKFERALPLSWNDRLKNMSAVDFNTTKESASTYYEAWYLVEPHETHESIKNRTSVYFYYRQRLGTDQWGKIRELRFEDDMLPLFSDLADQELLPFLNGIGARSSSQTPWSSGHSRADISSSLYEILLPQLSATGRFVLLKKDRILNPDQVTPLKWGGKSTCQFQLELTQQNEKWILDGFILKDGERIDLAQIPFLLKQFFIYQDCINLFDSSKYWHWITEFRTKGPIEVLESDIETFIQELIRIPDLPLANWPAQLAWQQIDMKPTFARMVFIPSSARSFQTYRYNVSFNYSGITIAADNINPSIVDQTQKRIILRDKAAEQSELAFLKQHHDIDNFDFIELDKLPGVASALIAQGWRVEVSGKKLQIASNFDVGVKSGIDWFDVSIDGTFDGKSFDLPTLLREVRAGSKFIHLDDGSIGLLPEEWFNRLSVFERFGKLTADGQSLRLAKAQLSLIDALTANLPKVKLDKEFQKWRTKLKSFDGIKPVNAPTGFKGKLRNYQKAGLAWLEFQREFGFGGCLADDMGLGKTIQVLAFLQAQHLKTKGPMTGTTLIVVPKSLIHNWMQEAEKFTPKLKVLIYSGIDRFKLIEKFQNYQIIICTYGVLRQDIEALLTIEFDRVILDEAQNIKNSSSLSSKACRLLKAKQRLALTGTPVENHLGELWSLFEFLNPGLLGSSAVFQNLTKTSKNQDGALPSVLHKALSPFLLRRTKEEVLKELPPKTEQVIYCDLEKDQQQYYDELRMYYQSILKDKVDKVGFQKSKIHVLEALLRLRQTACHPGLVDKNKETLSSGKLNVLDEMVEEVLSEKNHKLLIFSQFTSLLSIVQKRMRQKGLVYEYLDGKTSDRAERVKRFREDPDCRIFLISLKAGGTGLNLTEADYVFILDPWWNPAVEAQAIDRTHRIGQTKPVFAYRLIARGTVEEKILQLQGKKKKLFEELFSPAQAGLKSLTAQDIEFLLQ